MQVMDIGTVNSMSSLYYSFYNACLVELFEYKKPCPIYSINVNISVIYHTFKC